LRDFLNNRLNRFLKKLDAFPGTMPLRGTKSPIASNTDLGSRRINDPLQVFCGNPSGNECSEVPQLIAGSQVFLKDSGYSLFGMLSQRSEKVGCEGRSEFMANSDSDQIQLSGTFECFFRTPCPLFGNETTVSNSGKNDCYRTRLIEFEDIA
jgi:hypothetical protein